MSFILDALRKSEHERQRQTGPALVETTVAPPRPRSNPWATAAIALLLLNLVAVGVVLLWRSRDEPAAVAAPPPAPAPAPAAVPIPPAVATPVESMPAPAAQASITRTLPEPAVAPAPVLRQAGPPPATTRNPLEQEVSGYVPPMEHEAAEAAARPPAGPAAVAPARRGSVVYESLPEAAPGAAHAPPPQAAQQATAAPLPTADELTARGGLAEMRLELHVYSNRAQDRFVFVNGRRYREGDTTAEGATIVEITADGAIMTAGGNRFLLSRD